MENSDWKFSTKSGKPIEDQYKLDDYASWYVLKYAPSESKLRTRLVSKCADPEMIEKAFLTVATYVNDQKNAESRSVALAKTGKPLFNVKSSLIRKWYSKTAVSSAMESAKESVEWSDVRARVESRLKTYLAKSYSRSFATSSLTMDYSAFKEELREFVKENYPADRDILALHFERDPLPEDSKLRKKTVESLMRKGFRYSDIES